VKSAKTNAVRLLDRLGLRYELREYEVDPEDLAAETVARKVGLPPEQVFKTLVARGDKHDVCLAVVPGNCELDLKALAKATGDKKIDTVPLKEVEPLTGYIRGGVTALACKKPYPVFIDETAHLLPWRGRSSIDGMMGGRRGRMESEEGGGHRHGYLLTRCSPVVRRGARGPAPSRPARL
jgi:Cys-tRNA(Pro)/Cys-tRNA(Cys) deacylase